MDNDKQYYIVDKDTGDIIGETRMKEPTRTGRRILAFIVLYLLSLITRFVTYQYIRLVLWLLDKIYGLSRLAYYLVLFFGGATAFGILIWAFMLGTHAMIGLPEKIVPSRKGARYMILGICVAAFYLVSLITMIAGIANNASGLQYIWHIIIIIFFVVFAFIGKSQAQSS